MPLKLPHYNVGVWSNHEDPQAWSFCTVYLGNSLGKARDALKKLRKQLPKNAAAWASYIYDQWTRRPL